METAALDVQFLEARDIDEVKVLRGRRQVLPVSQDPAGLCALC